MNKFAKIADGLGGWLTFEQWCGRRSLFRECHLAHPMSQLLQHQFPGRVLIEVEHPVLAGVKKGPGRKPRIDFAVVGEGGVYDLVVEVKWVSESLSLPRDIIRDIVRLDLLLPTYARQAVMFLAGGAKDIARLFQNPLLQASRPDPRPLERLLSKEGHNRSAIYFLHNVTPSRKKLLSQALKVKAFQEVEVSRVIQLERSGPFPRSTTTKQYEVYVWRVMPRGKKFKAEEYDTLS